MKYWKNRFRRAATQAKPGKCLAGVPKGEGATHKGNRMVNVLPTPGTLVTSIVPSCSLTT